MKKVAIITGAGRGIGAATATLLAEKGYAVCINYKSSADAANALASQINQQHGKAIAIRADMANEKAIVELFNEVDATLGPVSALINNAGTNGGVCEVENITHECLHAVFATNVFGTFLACREAVKRMRQLGGGSIINITSEAAKFGGTRLAHYAASKAAINTFTIGFAREVAEHHIRVNAVSPGVIDTDMHKDSPPERIANLMNTLPMKRMGKSSEVSELIHWLVSDAASYISGAIIPVTGSR
jgi:NAD(P)-dependent dehydrogenase (short-subunit alcohol dehydrogenase family)